jgi:hypothetical protein
MNFASPAVLWALPAAGLPALIHLLSRRSARRARFSDLTLLAAVEARQRPRARLREWALLAARTLLVLALVLAAAGPVARGERTAAAGEGLDLVLLLDASYSTRAREAGRTRFERAREAGRRLLRRLAPGDRAAAAAFDESVLTPLSWTDAAGADAALGRAAPGLRGTDAGAALSAARDLLSRSPRGRRRAVVVLGDGAAHMLPSAAPAPADGAVVLGLSFPALANEWIADVRPAPGSSARAPRLSVRVGSVGAPPKTVLDAWVGARRAGSVSAAAPAGAEAEATLALPPPDDPRAPAWSGRVAARPDALPDDDDAYFSLRHRPSPRALVLPSDPASERAGRAGWFLRELFGGGEGSIAGREADFLAAARWSEADLSSYGTVILPDAARLPPGLAAALERFAARGGGVWIVPGSDARPEDLAALSAWLPARLGAVEASSRAGGLRVARAGPETAGWNDYELARVAFSRRYRLEPAPGAEVWIAGADGAPLLAAGAVGRGRAVVWAAPLDVGSSNLGLKPLFPAWAKACLSLTLPPAGEAESLQSLVGRPLTRTWRLDEPAPDRVTVRGPDGRRATIAVRGRRAELPSADAPGLYVFEEAGGPGTTFAVNLDATRGEGDLRPAPSPPWTPVEPDRLDDAFSAAVYGVDERGLCLALAALALIAETFLSFPRRPSAGGRATSAGARAVVLGALLLAIAPASASAQQGDRFVWAQLRLGPDWDPYPDAPGRAVAWLGRVTSAKIGGERRVLELDDPELFSSPFLYLAGGGAPPELTDAQLRRLRQYLAGGGFLWIEDSTGGPRAAFDRWARKTIGLALPGSDLRPLPSDNVIYRTFFLLRGPAGCARADEALEGAVVGERVAILYSRADSLGAWAQDAFGRPLKACGGDAERERSRRLTLNVLMYSMTGSYKADAVHQALILQKLGETPR